MIGCPDLWKCAVACLCGELSQQPTWPHSMQSLRCTHEPPIFRQSSHPSALAVTSRIWSRCVQTSIANQPTTLGAALAERSVFVRMAGVPESDAVADHSRPSEQPRALHRVLPEAVADRIDRRLEALVTGTDLTGEQPHLPGIRLRQSREPHAE